MPLSRLALALVVTLSSGRAFADEAPEISDIFPDTLLTRAVAFDHLGLEQIGPPAEHYDQVTRTEGAATELEAAVEALAFGPKTSAFAASDSLRRYGRLSFALRRVGRPVHAHSWFLAEHVGLANVPATMGMFYTSSEDPTEIAWMNVEHPVGRMALLDPKYEIVNMGAIRTPSGEFSIAAQAVQPAANTQDLRQTLMDQLIERWPEDSAPPDPAPTLEEELDAVCAQVASGRMTAKKAMKAVSKMHKKQPYLSGAARYQLFYLAPGQDLDVSTFQLPEKAQYLAVGQASGNLGSGPFEYSVFLVVATSQAE